MSLIIQAQRKHSQSTAKAPRSLSCICAEVEHNLNKTYELLSCLLHSMHVDLQFWADFVSARFMIVVTI
jgi:hypothetical protein